MQKTSAKPDVPTPKAAPAKMPPNSIPAPQTATRSTD